MGNKERSCCFSGHRKLPKGKQASIVKRLEREIDNLIAQGVTEFISGGAIGFDQTAAIMIRARKEQGRDIRLVFALPCKNQDKLWTAEQKRLYHSLLKSADEIVYVSEDYTEDCMKKRNFYMVDHAAYCICALLYPRSGTGQTLRYAQAKGLQAINVADSY